MTRQQLKNILKELNINPNHITKANIVKIFAKAYHEFDREDLFGFLPKTAKDTFRKYIDQSDILIDVIRLSDHAELHISLPTKKMKDNIHLSHEMQNLKGLKPIYGKDGLSFIYELKPFEVVKEKPKPQNPRFHQN